jgi:hypothetical protein
MKHVQILFMEETVEEFYVLWSNEAKEKIVRIMLELYGYF